MAVESRRPSVIRPGLFSVEAAADRRRREFDHHNEAILHKQVPVDVVFFGDSITHWWDVSTYFGRAGRVVVNRGIGGDTSEYARRRFAADVLQLKPKYAVILIGVNNTWALDAWHPEERRTAEQICGEVVADVESMLKAAQEHGIVPILCSILPTRIDRYARNEDRNRLIVRINSGLKDLAERLNVIYVDYHTALADADGVTLREGLADDGLHPHVLGYDIMAAVLRETLAGHGIDL
jgi:lysophospholipase L1-like esterase